MMKENNNTNTQTLKNTHIVKGLDICKLLEHPSKQERCFQSWRELGGYFQAHFRLQADGQLDLIGKVRSCSEIQAFCEALSRQLRREFELCTKD